MQDMKHMGYAVPNFRAVLIASHGEDEGSVGEGTMRARFL